MNDTPIRLQNIGVDANRLPPPAIESIAEQIGPRIAERITRLRPQFQREASEVIYAVIDQGNASLADADVTGSNEADRDNNVLHAIACIDAQLRGSQWTGAASGNPGPSSGSTT